MQSKELEVDGLFVSLSESDSRITGTKHVGLVMGFFGLILSMIALRYGEGILWVALLFSLSGFSVLLWNFLKLPFAAGLTVSVMNAALFAILHCYLLPENSSMHPGLFIIQASFWLVPFIVFGTGDMIK